MTRQYCLNKYRLLEHHESAQSERVLTNQYMGKLNNAKDIKHSKAIKLESGDVRLQNVKIWVHDGIPFFTLIYYCLT